MVRRALPLLAALIAGAAAPAAHACAAGPSVPAATVERALRSGRDVLAERLLDAPGGPTLAAAERVLPPLRWARGPKGTRLTRSGVYYLPFADPATSGAGAAMLHVADGSEIDAGSAAGPSLRVLVRGAPFASCGPRLADGWLPILQTRDGGDAQESFAARIPGAAGLASFVRVEGPGPIRFALSARGLRRRGDELVRGRDVVLAFGGARARFDGSSIVFARGPAYAVFPLRPAPLPRLDVPAVYAPARASVAAGWRSKLAAGASIDVPEPYVEHALRALLVQDLVLTWRYSIGNPYQEFSFPESVDGAQVLAEYGFAQTARAMLRTSFTRRPVPYPHWKDGERLVGVALAERLAPDAAFLARATPVLRRYVAELGRSFAPNGLLARERFSSDIPDSVYGLHSQAVVWEGLEAMAAVWAGAGDAADAARARAVAARLAPALRRAVASSERRLPDGSLFLPMRLLSGQQPFASVVASRRGSYWNLVAPYALASGFLSPAQERGALRYMLLHGSYLLGLVRSGGYALYGRSAPFPVSATDEVYGVNTARVLAALDRPDLLVLALYGDLAAGMTRDTFVAGEAASVAPLAGAGRERAMYLPPNSVANDAFLETLRVALVQETAAGLRLAFATPRGWLAPGKRIAVSGLPTRFGPLSYSLTAARGSVRVVVQVPSQRPPRTLLLRLRLPHATRTLDLSGRRGTVALTVRLR